MYWQVSVPGIGDILGATVKVEAENWFSALKTALERYGGGDSGVANVTCTKHPDGSVDVKDFVSGRIYALQPHEGEEPLDLDLDAEVFFERDVVMDGGGIVFKERFVVVPEGSNEGACESLAASMVGELVAAGRNEGALHVSVQVFDDKFQTRPLRPALVCVMWRDGIDEMELFHPRRNPEPLPEPRIRAAESVEPEPVALAERLPEEAPTPIPLDSRLPGPPPAVAASPLSNDERSPNIPPEPIPLEESLPEEASAPVSLVDPIPSEEAPVSFDDEPRVDDGMMEDGVVRAFEALQDMYLMKDHDQVAAFALEVSAGIIPSVAGAVFLNRPGRYELYLCACLGDPPDDTGRSYSMRKGLMGFSLTKGIVVNLHNALEDGRLDPAEDYMPVTDPGGVLVAPMAFEGRTHGALKLFSGEGNGGFSERDVNVLSYIAGAVAEYIETSLPSREADFHDREFGFTPGITDAESSTRFSLSGTQKGTSRKRPPGGKRPVKRSTQSGGKGKKPGGSPRKRGGRNSGAQKRASQKK